ncbi:MAG: BtpA/SgcQ family protein [Planctomycetes bacterium]|jgi:hypothetical protein|nr:BtpA/SgcQ family protein [Planctomycetota bacterium]
MNLFRALFPVRRPLIGMVHLGPLPGSPRFGGDFEAALRRARRDAEVLAAAGFDGLLVENYGDAPFLPEAVGPETIAAMALATARVMAAVPLPVGVNVLRNDARAALAVAAVTGARFIRVNVHTGLAATDQGLIAGRAAETLRERARLGAGVAILADVLVKHSRPLYPDEPARAALETAERGLADALVVSGEATGAEPAPDRVRAVREAVPGTPVLLGSGLSAANATALFPLADGAIAGTAVKRGGRTEGPVDPARARRLAAACREVGA